MRLFVLFLLGSTFFIVDANKYLRGSKVAPLSSTKRLSTSSIDSGLSVGSYDKSQCGYCENKFKTLEEAKKYLFENKSKMEIFMYCDTLIQKDAQKIAMLVNVNQKPLIKGPRQKRDNKLYDLRLHFIMLSVFFPMEYRMQIMNELVHLPVKKANKIALEALNMSQCKCETSYILERVSTMLTKALSEPINIGSMKQNPLYQNSFNERQPRAMA